VAAPALARYVHPRALSTEGEHDFGLEAVSDVVSNYPRWIAELCEPHLGQTTLEVGAGYGVVTQYLATGRRLVVVDSSARCVEALRHRFAGHPDVEVQHADLREFEPGDLFDAVVMINTLEHIPDDVAALIGLKRFLRPAGRAVIYVPAFNFLFSDFDRKVGHQRRYSKQMMSAVIVEAGMTVAELRYANIVGLPAWLVLTKLLRKDPSDRRAAQLWDRTGTVASRWLERRIEPPIGLNLLAVAQTTQP
jgi:SAM-dependent methyltransferase